MFVKTKPGRIKVIFIAFSCLLIYTLTAFLLLPPQTEKAEKKVEKIPYRNAAGDLCILAGCDELSRFCAIQMNFDDKKISVVLFDSLERAKNYGFSYDRTIFFDSEAAINAVGRIGGVVFSCERWYNDNENYSFLGSRKLMGSQILELSAADPQLRGPLVCEFLRTLLKFKMTKSDFSYIISMCRTDLSIPDYVNLWQSAAGLCENITVYMG